MSTDKQARGLGRGFDALLPTGFDVAFDPTASQSAGQRVGDSVAKLAVDAVVANPLQPRQQFDSSSMAQLTESVRAHGVLQPVIVSDLGGGRYELIAGERRLRASKAAGLGEIPAIVRTFDEQQKLELALIENLQREDLNPLEVATAYRKLMDQFGFTMATIAERVGRDQSTVSNTVRLLNLPDEAKEAMMSGTISEGHGRQILALENNPAKQLVLLQLITGGSWSVRQAEQFVRSVRDGKTRVEVAIKRLRTETPLTRDLGEYLGAKVEVHKLARGGRLTIEYYSDEELDRIYDVIRGRTSTR
jgi:ParB family transcriptional regulator, chromosome partitioning protein